MGKLKTIAGILATFAGMVKEEWGDMDQRLLRIGIGVLGFVLSALFWFYFIRHAFPF
ncbi:MAG: hypothetical protein HY832_02890 [Candidatus Aenigmarchaeota archaeon]|nr:hypothetical protein [Candidatus Aenigmarchaeota archaeon]